MEAPADQKTALRSVILSTGRAGSTFFAKLLQSSGIACGHEEVFDNVKEAHVRAKYLATENTAESSWLAVPFISAPWFSPDIKIVHLVREPLAVVKSFHDINFFSDAKKGRKYNRLVYQNTPISADTQDRLVSSVDHYFYWNDLIRKQLAVVKNEAITVRLEDLSSGDPAARRSLGAFLGVEIGDFDEVVNRKTQQKKRHGEDTFDYDLARSLIKDRISTFGDFGYPDAG